MTSLSQEPRESTPESRLSRYTAQARHTFRREEPKLSREQREWLLAWMEYVDGCHALLRR